MADAALETIQNKLNATALGVEVWLDDGHSSLSRRLINPDDLPRTGDVRTVEEQQLGYGRIGDGWGLVTRTVTFDEINNVGWEVDGDYAAEEPKPLLRASRALRIAAIGFIPQLIEELEEEASKVIEAVEQAKRIAESIK